MGVSTVQIQECDLSRYGSMVYLDMEVKTRCGSDSVILGITFDSQLSKTNDLQTDACHFLSRCSALLG